MDEINLIEMDEAQIDNSNEGPVDKIEYDQDLSLLPNHNNECKDVYVPPARKLVFTLQLTVYS